MRKRPEACNWLALFHTAVAASIFVQVMYLAGDGLWKDPLRWPLYFNTLNLAVIFISLLTAFAARNVSQALWFLVPLGLGLVGLNNWVSGEASVNYTSQDTLIGTAIFALFHLGYLQPDVRRILLRPELRWWAVAPRLNFEAPVFLEGAEGVQLRAHSFDISRSGVFVRVGLDQLAKIENVGTPLTLRLTHGRFRVMRIPIALVRMTRGSGRYPEGAGLSFKNLTSEQRRFLDNILTATV